MLSTNKFLLHYFSIMPQSDNDFDITCGFWKSQTDQKSWSEVNRCLISDHQALSELLKDTITAAHQPHIQHDYSMASESKTRQTISGEKQIVCTPVTSLNVGWWKTWHKFHSAHVKKWESDLCIPTVCSIKVCRHIIGSWWRPVCIQ